MPNIDIGALLQTALFMIVVIGLMTGTAYALAQEEIQRYEVAGNLPEETVRAFRRETKGTTNRLASKIHKLGYWHRDTDTDNSIFERICTTPEAMYFKIRMSEIKSNIRPAQLTIPDFIDHLQYATERRISTVSAPEYGVWLIVHRPGYDSTDESYKPYLDKMKNDGM